MEKKGIIFDFFGVICSEIAPFWFEDYFSTHESIELKEKYVSPADRGDITLNALFNNLSQLVGKKPQEVEDEWLGYVTINNELVKLIHTYRNSYKIGLCSNAPAEFIKKILHTHNLYTLFDTIIISSEERITKPDRKIFDITCIRMKMSPGDLIFIDDNPLYVKSADSVGITSIQYQDNQQLIAQLTRILGSQ